MAEIAYKEAAAHIQNTGKTGFSPVYLVFGDPYLRQRITSGLIAAILPEPESRSISLEIVDTAEGAAASEAAERAGTFSFFAGNKVVLLKAPNLFAAAFDPAKHLEKVRAARDSGDMYKAARLLEDLLAHRGCRAEDIAGTSAEEIAARLKIDTDYHPDVAWISEVAEKCEELPDSAGSTKTDDAGILLSAIKRGLPKNHYLIIAADGVDRRTGLYKAIKEAGAVINCAVPTGAKKAERDEQQRILWQIAKETLAPHQKSLESGAFEQVYQRIGFDPGGFAASLEKLVLYAADRARITTGDVAAVLEQSREDPVFSFTGALAGRDADMAIYYLHSLLASGFHYMQLLSAMINQVRRLVAVKSFVSGGRGTQWVPSMGYDRFRQQVMPAVVEYDKALSVDAREIKSRLQPGATGKKSTAASDLVIAKNPKNPYPVYQTFLQADRFTQEELRAALKTLHRADIKLKTTGQAPAAVLESAIFRICRTTGKA
ncbi:MAG: DNA polymerase III subunit delta, partial [Desulfobacterales bacterium]